MGKEWWENLMAKKIIKPSKFVINFVKTIDSIREQIYCFSKELQLNMALVGISQFLKTFEPGKTKIGCILWEYIIKSLKKCCMSQKAFKKIERECNGMEWYKRCEGFGSSDLIQNSVSPLNIFLAQTQESYYNIVFIR